jgi:hypothetical protein
MNDILEMEPVLINDEKARKQEDGE